MDLQKIKNLGKKEYFSNLEKQYGEVLLEPNYLSKIPTEELKKEKIIKLSGIYIDGNYFGTIELGTEKGFNEYSIHDETGDIKKMRFIRYKEKGNILEIYTGEINM